MTFTIIHEDIRQSTTYASYAEFKRNADYEVPVGMVEAVDTSGYLPGGRRFGVIITTEELKAMLDADYKAAREDIEHEQTLIAGSEKI